MLQQEALFLSLPFPPVPPAISLLPCGSAFLLMRLRLLSSTSSLCILLFKQLFFEIEEGTFRIVFFCLLSFYRLNFLVFFDGAGPRFPAPMNWRALELRVSFFCPYLPRPDTDSFSPLIEILFSCYGALPARTSRFFAGFFVFKSRSLFCFS